MTSNDLALSTRARVWADSSLRSALITRLQSIPAFLSLGTPGEQGFLADPEHWRAALYQELILNKVGGTFGVANCYAALTKHGVGWEVLGAPVALVSFLVELKNSGYVAFETNAAGQPVGTISVLADVLDCAERSISGTEGPCAPINTPPAGVISPFDPQPLVTASAHAQTSVASSAPEDGDADADNDLEATMAESVIAIAPVRQPASGAEATWLADTTAALLKQGLRPDAVAALIDVAHWGVPVACQIRSG